MLRLISLVYPSLEDHVLHMLPPMEVAADLARKKAKEEHPELEDSDIGVCFISPCPSKMSYVHNNFGEYKSKVDAVVAISDVYFRLLDVMKRDEIMENLSETGMNGIIWAESGGESTAILNEGYLAADGILKTFPGIDKPCNERPYDTLVVCIPLKEHPITLCDKCDDCGSDLRV